MLYDLEEFRKWLEENNRWVYSKEINFFLRSDLLYDFDVISGELYLLDKKVEERDPLGKFFKQWKSLVDQQEQQKKKKKKKNYD